MYKYRMSLNPLLTTNVGRKYLVNYAACRHETFGSSESLTQEQQKLRTFPVPGHAGGGIATRLRGWGAMGKIVKRFTTDERGSATMEYGLVAAGLSLAIITVLQGIGMRLTANVVGTQVSMH
jgi:pilus assembly protein Flp/PilA